MWVVSALLSQIAVFTTKTQDLLTAYAKGVITLEDYQKSSESFEKLIEKAQKSLEERAEKSKLKVINAQQSFLQAQYAPVKRPLLQGIEMKKPE